MNNLEYKFIKRKLKLYLIELYTILTLYGVGFLLFICSSEYAILHSINKNGDFVWNNLNLIWIFGLILIFIGFVVNIILYISILKLEKTIIKNFLKLITIGNKFINKWKKKIKNNLDTRFFFLNIFNIEVWIRSINKNFDYAILNKDTQNKSKDKLTSIIEEYYEQIKNNKSENNK